MAYVFGWQVEFTGVDGAGGEESRVKESEGPGIAEAAQRLGCTTAALERALCHRTVKVGHVCHMGGERGVGLAHQSVWVAAQVPRCWRLLMWMLHVDWVAVAARVGVGAHDLHTSPRCTRRAGQRGGPILIAHVPRQIASIPNQLHPVVIPTPPATGVLATVRVAG